MKFAINTPLFSLFFFLKKKRWVYGISSKIKGSLYHYLFFDVDDKDSRFVEWFKKWYGKREHLIYETPHGFHAIVFQAYTKKEALKYMLQCPFVDISWVLIGWKRGYWFLHNHVPCNLPKATYMRVQNW